MNASGLRAKIRALIACGVLPRVMPAAERIIPGQGRRVTQIVVGHQPHEPRHYPQTETLPAGGAPIRSLPEADRMPGLSRGPCLLTTYEFEQMLGPIQRWT